MGLTEQERKDAQNWYDGLNPNEQDSLLAKWIDQYYEENIIDCEG